MKKLTKIISVMVVLSMLFTLFVPMAASAATPQVGDEFLFYLENQNVSEVVDDSNFIYQEFIKEGDNWKAITAPVANTGEGGGNVGFYGSDNQYLGYQMGEKPNPNPGPDQPENVPTSYSRYSSKQNNTSDNRDLKIEVTWKNLPAGTYDLQYFVGGHSTDSKSMTVTVNGEAAGVQNIYGTNVVDQKRGEFKSFGTYSFAQDGDVKVEFASNTAPGGIRFSAVKFVYQGEPDSGEIEAPEVGAEYLLTVADTSMTNEDNTVFQEGSGSWNKSTSTWFLYNQSGVCRYINNEGDGSLTWLDMPAGKYELQFWSTRLDSESKAETFTVQNCINGPVSATINGSGTASQSNVTSGFQKVFEFSVAEAGNIVVDFSNQSGMMRVNAAKLIYLGEPETGGDPTPAGEIVDVYYQGPSQPSSFVEIPGFTRTDPSKVWNISTNPSYSFIPEGRGWGYTIFGEGGGTIEAELPKAGSYDLYYYFCNYLPGGVESESLYLDILTSDSSDPVRATANYDNIIIDAIPEIGITAKVADSKYPDNGGSGWVKVGTYNFAEGKTNVGVSGGRFSAAKFVYQGEAEQPGGPEIGTEYTFSVTNKNNAAENNTAQNTYKEFSRNISPDATDWAEYTGQTVAGYYVTYNASGNENLGLPGVGARYAAIPAEGVPEGAEAEAKIEITWKNLPAGQYQLLYRATDFGADARTITATINDETSVNFETKGTQTDANQAVEEWIQVGNIYNFDTAGDVKVDFTSQIGAAHPGNFRLTSVKFVYVGEPGEVEAKVYYEDGFEYEDYEAFKTASDEKNTTDNTNQHLGELYTATIAEDTENAENHFLKIEGPSAGEGQAQKIQIYFEETSSDTIVMRFKTFISSDSNLWQRVGLIFEKDGALLPVDDKSAVFAISQNAEPNKDAYLTRDPNGTAVWGCSDDQGTRVKIPRNEWVDVQLTLSKKPHPQVADAYQMSVSIGNTPIKKFLVGSTYYDTAPIQQFDSIVGWWTNRQSYDVAGVGFQGLDDIVIQDYVPAKLFTTELYTVDYNALTISDVPYSMTVSDFVYQITPAPGVVPTVVDKTDDMIVETGDKLAVSDGVESQEFAITVGDPFISSDDVTITYVAGLNGLKRIEGVPYGMTVDSLKNILTVRENVTLDVKRGDESLTDQLLSTSDILEVTYKGYTEKYELYVEGQRFTADAPFTVDWGTRTIAAPLGLTIADLTAALHMEDGVTYKIMNGDTEIVDTAAQLRSGYVVSTEMDGKTIDYTIAVESLISSDTYTIDETNLTIGTVDKRTAVIDFLAAITPASDVTIAVSGKTDNDLLQNNDILVVTKGGITVNYTILVEEGNPVSDLTSKTGKYTIDNTAQTIANVDFGTDVAEFIAELEASNGGSIKVMNQDMEEITQGVLSGSETVRVYPTAVLTGEKDHKAYAIVFNDQPVVTHQTVSHVGDPTTLNKVGTWANSGAAVPPGYNGETTVNTFDASAYIDFYSQIQEAGAYDVYIYSTYWSANLTDPVKIYAGDGTGEPTVVNVNFGQQFPDDPNNGGWIKLGTFDFDAVHQVEVDGVMETRQGYVKVGPGLQGGSCRLTAVKFEKTATIKADSTKLTIGGTTVEIEDNQKVSNVAADKLSFDITFNMSPNRSTINSSTIRLISENGYEIETTGSYNTTTNTYSATTTNELIPGMTYYLQVTNGVKAPAGSTISNSYVYVIETVKNEYSAASDVQYRDASGKLLQDAGGASSVKASTVLKNDTAEDKTVKLIVAFYSNGLVETENLSIQEVLIPANGSVTVNSDITLSEVGGSSDFAKVFVWDTGENENVPLTEVYYVK